MDEIKIIFNYIHDRDFQFYLMLCTMLLTGIRPGELCGIKWENFSSDFSIVEINESITTKKYDNHNTKTEYSIREIPLDEFLSFEYKRKYENSHHPSGYVFLNKRKNTYCTQYVDTRFKRLKKELEDEMNIDLGQITPHYLRHTFASIGIQSGVELTEMVGLLGHANYKTLVSTYAHSNMQRKAESINKISSHVHQIMQIN